MTNYQITIGYKAVITVNVKAADEKEARSIAIKKFANAIRKIRSNSIELQADNFSPQGDGCIDMDATWNMYDK